MPFLIVLGFLLVTIILLIAGKNPWDILFINPLINTLVFIDRTVAFGSFGLSIIIFTIALRLVTIPFTIRQLESTRAMQAVQPAMQEIQKKYKDPKRRQEEMVKLYREHNINPLGCFMPFLIQMVVFIALYRALVFTVGGSPESLVGLSQRLYPIPFLQEAIPLNQHFLWLDLGQPDTTFILPLLVGVSTYVQQRLSITPNASPQMQQQQQMMTWMMPIMLVFITLNLPSGVGIYWVVSNVFSLFASYYVYGRRLLSWRQILPLPMPSEESAPAAKARNSQDGERDEGKDDDHGDAQSESDGGGSPDDSPPDTARGSHGKRRGKRKNRR
jgi:YidC/Oxa1 family membrane protein insertase